MKCEICPRLCGVDRELKKGFCGMGDRPFAGKAVLHPYEEPILSGWRGSGAIFFSGCNLKCCFCQNKQISHDKTGKEVSEDRLSEIYLNLQDQGAHNINLVNPTHFTHAVIRSIKKAKSRMRIPFIWNSSGYERVEALEELKGLIEVFMPDLKYYSSKLSAAYSGAENYFDYASRAILEMYKQVGGVKLNEAGLIKSGLIIRHLILPNSSHDSLRVLEWINDNIPKDAYISLMGKYTPIPGLENVRGLNRKITKREYELVTQKLYDFRFENGFVQSLDSVGMEYTPMFDLSGL